MSTKRKRKKKIKNEKRIKVNAVECGNCGCIIYSRYVHDFHYCLCNMTYVDGGFDYLRVGYLGALPKTVTKFIKATKEELYRDWNYQTNKFGIIGVEGWTNKTLNAD